jgi:hypothetical protein
MTNRGVQATLEGSNSFLRESDTPEVLPSFDGDPTFLYQDYLPQEILEREGHLLGEEEKPTHLELLSCTVQSGGQVWLRYKVSNQQDHEK